MNKALLFMALLLCLKMHGQSLPDEELPATASIAQGAVLPAILYWEKPNLQKEKKKPRELSTVNITSDPFSFSNYTTPSTASARGETKNDADPQLNEHTLLSGQKTRRSMASGMRELNSQSYLNKLPNNFNTSSGELAPFRYADKLYYSTVLEENYIPTKNGEKKFINHPVTRVFESKYNSMAIESNANPRSAVLNTTNVTLTADARRMYFTFCMDDQPNSQQECTIWYRNRTYEGDWTPAVKLPDFINKRHYTSTQPSVGYDWHLKKEVLFFVSDRPGGMGGLDIWYCEINRDGSFGKPRMAPFNTTFDDITPYFHQQTQTLFFSSNGMHGNGGFDVFQTKKTDELSWKMPQNIGAYINTPQDELYYTYHTGSGFAYFISAAAMEADKGGDIMEARVFTDCQLNFFDRSNKKPLAAINIEVENLETGITNYFNSGTLSNKTNLELAPGGSYRFTIKSAGFLPVTFEVDTEDVGFIKKLEKEIYLMPFVRP